MDRYNYMMIGSGTTAMQPASFYYGPVHTHIMHFALLSSSFAATFFFVVR